MDNPHHEHLVKEIAEQYKSVLEDSPQAVYIYLDDVHKICNEKFAKMLGYKSVQEWVENETPVEDVVEKDRDKIIKAYMDASRNLTASALQASWKAKNGKTIDTEVLMSPLPYSGETFVIHFISPRQ